MTEILVQWLNEEVGLSKTVDANSLAQDFASGYYLGEILNKFQLQNDFKFFSVGQTSDAKLNNFTRLEPTLHLLEIPFDTNIAYDVMLQKHGIATRLLYQLYVSLQRKVKNNLTGAAMETMRAPAPVKLQNIESGLYRERLKTLIPRESDLTLEEVSSKFVAKQMENERKARLEKYKEVARYEQIKDEQRKANLEKARIARHNQTELLAKIQAATVHIPKPPPSRTLQAMKIRREVKRKKEAEATQNEITRFEQNLKKLVAPTASGDEEKTTEDMSNTSDEYLNRIKTQLEEDRSAREERAKRRRKVMVDQMKAHEAQEEAHRQEQIVQRLMRQSQQERRIAVQLMQVRREKDTIRKNRIFREKQYEERRLKDFQDALDLEAQMSKLAKQQYEEETKKAQEIHLQIMAQRAQEKYKKHYDMCQENVLSIVDFACKIAEYRELTEKKIPEKCIREWKELMMEGRPLYTTEEDSWNDQLQLQIQDILDQQDMAEYKNMIGEWQLSDEMTKKPESNNVFGHILHRMFNMVAPPPPESPKPQFPVFPVKAAILGKMFAGKTMVASELAKKHRLVHLAVDKLLSDAIEAFHGQEREKPAVVASQHSIVIESSTSINIEPPTPAMVNSQLDQHNFDEELEKSDPEKPIPVEEEEEEEPQLTKRAALGKEALEYLSCGKAVPDKLLVGIIVAAINNIPKGTGWLLDGFPTNVTQAQSLEKAITGNDVNEAAVPVKKKLSKRSSLVADPRPPPEPKLSAGALDVVIVQDVTDEIILKRAHGRSYGLQQDTLYHEEFNPAPQGSQTGLGKSEKVIPVKDAAFDQEQVQHRITGFHDNWPALEKFYTQLSTVQHVDGENDKNYVYVDVEKTLFETLEKIKQKSESASMIEEVEPIEETLPPTSSQLTSESSRKESATSKSSVQSISSRKSKSPRDKSAEKGGKKSRSRSGSGKRSAKDKKKSRPTTPVAPPEPEIVEPGPTVPPPKPGSREWEYVDEELPMEVAQTSVPIWENIENSYTTTCKHTFRQIRLEREGIIRYIFSNRKDFISFLKRPDTKQLFVSSFQKDFNEIPNDLRADEETKAELHQRLDDLKERLWSICDTRKEEAEKEREGIMAQGWLEDHLGVLINEYLTIMQIEVDRFHDSCKLLKDYYVGMQGKILPEDSTSYHRLPLVELDIDDPDVSPANSNETITSDKPVSPQASETDNKKPGKKNSKEDQLDAGANTAVTEAESRTKIPLIQRGAAFASLFAEESGKGKKGKAAPPPGGESDSAVNDGDLEEKTIQEAFNVALSLVTNVVQTDVAAKEQEEEEERRLKEEQEKAKAAAAGGGAAPKKGGKSAKGKKGGKKSKSPTPTPPTPVEEESEEDKRRKEIKIKMKEEYFAALYCEEENTKITLELIRHRASKTLSNLKQTAEKTYTEMQEWLGARFLQEMEAIDQLSEVTKNAIETATKLKHEMRLEQNEFVVKSDLRVVRTPTPPPRPVAVDIGTPDTFTIPQLLNLQVQFREVAPSGLIANKAFMDLIADTAVLTYGADALPENWLNITYAQLVELCQICSPESEYVDWRKFLLVAAQPWTAASIQDLLDALQNFCSVDIAGNGWITEDQYNLAENWLFNEESAYRPVSPEDPTEPYPYDRIGNLQKFFFTLFADHDQTPARLDYINMLMYFAMDSDALLGFNRALSVTTGEIMPTISKKPRTAQSTHSIKGDDTSVDVLGGQKASVMVEQAPRTNISIQNLWSVLHHGSSRLGDSHRFSISEDPEDKYSMERLKSIYEDLEEYDYNALSVQVLLQHPVVQDAFASSKKYQLPDIKTIFIHQALRSLETDNSSVQASI